MRSSHRRLPVVLAALATLTLAGLSSGTEAEACTPPAPLPKAVPAVSFSTPSAALPKNAGLVLSVFGGALTETEIKAKITIEVRSGGTPIEGTLRALDESSGPFRFWHWQPTASELPVGALTVHLQGGDAKEATDATVQIADRLFAVPTLAVTAVTANRLVIGEPGAPKITCSKPLYLGGCGETDGFFTIATRHSGVPQITYQHDPIAEADEPYLRQTISLYGRNDDGSIGTSDRRVLEGAVATYLDHPYAQYCVELTTRSIVDGTAVKTEKCIPHSVDLAVSEAENESTVSSGLDGCTNTVYPEGTSAENPTGSSSSGCSLSRHGGAGSFGLCAVAVGLAAMAFGRRVRRPSGSRR